MGDYIRIGLDFGTHQTKVCVQRTPDEGHGHPVYEFFKFKDLQGGDNYFLPSIVQINDDDTLSYGFVDPLRERTRDIKPVINSMPKYQSLDVETEIKRLIDKYSLNDIGTVELKALSSIVNTRSASLKKQYDENVEHLVEENANNKRLYAQKKEVFRYFKQATFSEREWFHSIDYKLVSIWYLSYVLFCLEEVYGENFSINMGIPASDKTYDSKKKEAVSILLSAYKLVEKVYGNDIKAFLSEKIDDLKEKTEIVAFSQELKEEYIINIFPEAYASMVTLTSRGKITPGMCLAVDIGGGTTDVSFFTIKDQRPSIYRYWSIPKGLNYVAEESGYDYQGFNFEDNASPTVIDRYNHDKTSIINRLFEELTGRIQNKDKYKTQIRLKLESGVVVYNGGGSIYAPLTTNMKVYFNDVKVIDSDMWREENIIDKNSVSEFCKILTTSYGLSLCDKDEEVELHDYRELFSIIGIDETSEGRTFIDKDMV